MSCASLLRLLRPVVGLFILSTPCTGGCLPDDPVDGLVTPGGGKVDPGGGRDSLGGADSSDVAKAFFVLHRTELRSPGWPDDYTGYSLFVCDPALSPIDVATIRADIPGATVLAYANCQDIPLGLHSANPYYAALEAAFDSSLCVIDLATRTVVRQYGYTGVPGSGTPHYVLQPASTEILVAFLRDVTMTPGWDGVYLDQCTLDYPPWRRSDLLDRSPSFDFDADGVADTIDEVAAQYRFWRGQFTRRLREELGDDAILVGNSGGALGDPQLNGITLEGVGERFRVEDARTYLTQQQAVSGTPFKAVLWVTTPAADFPSRELARELGIHYGVIDPTG